MVRDPIGYGKCQRGSGSVVSTYFAKTLHDAAFAFVNDVETGGEPQQGTYDQCQHSGRPPQSAG